MLRAGGRLAHSGAAAASRLLSSTISNAPAPAWAKSMSDPVVPPADALRAAPEDVTQTAVLAPGVKVVTEDRFGLTSTVGVFLPGGARFETPETAGSTLLSDLLMLRGTRTMSGNDITEAFNEIGAQVGCISAREHLAVNATVLRHHVPRAMQLLSDVVRRPYYDEGDFNEQLTNGEFMHMRQQETYPEYLSDLAHKAAFKDQSLALPVIPTPQTIANLTLPAFWKYRQALLRPKNMFVVGLGVEHSDFCRLSEEHFGSGWTDEQLTAPALKTEPSKYVGGELFVSNPQEQYVHMMLAFEGRSYHHADMFTLSVLHWWLGGGSSFSTGGPGKGIFSRLYSLLYISNSFQTVQASSSMYAETGIFGVYIAARKSPRRRSDGIADALRTVIRELHNLALNVPEDELKRTKNQLKSSLLMNLETSSVSFDDLGRQLQSYGKKYGSAELCRLIDNVTAADVSVLLHGMLASAPTLAAYGDTSIVPPLEQVAKWLK